jgi:ketosteroid isomerase-like protein
MLKKVIPIFVWAVMITASQATAQSQRKEQILASELTRFRMMTERDTARLRDYLSEDLIYVHSNTMKENREEHISAISTGRIIYQRMDRKQAGVRLYGRTAIVNGEIQVTGLLNNTPFDVFMLYTAVYRKNKGNWQLINWQTTRRPA